MATIETKTIKAEASKTPSSKTDLVEVTNFDKTAEVTGVGKKRPQWRDAREGPRAEANHGDGSGCKCRGSPGAASCGRKDADQRPN